MWNTYSVEDLAQARQRNRELEAARWRLADLTPEPPGGQGSTALTGVLNVLATVLLLCRPG